MSRDQCETGMDRVADSGERRSTQQHAQYDRQHAKGALPAVAHDRELRFAIPPSRKAVGGVG